MSWLTRIVRMLLLLPPSPSPPNPYTHPKIRELRQRRIEAADAVQVARRAHQRQYPIEADVFQDRGGQS